MKTLSYILMPLLIVTVIIYGYHKKIDIYASFIEGAKEGINCAISIFPYTISMVFAVNLFLHSQILSIIFGHLSKYIGPTFPIDILPMALLRPINGSAAMVVMTDIFTKYGPDSFIGRLASTIQGCTDTTLYVITLYFGSVGITKIRYALKAGLFADFVGIIVSFIIVYLTFGT